MKMPQPRDGWRVFAGEVGVIVLGVLIALGAQQAVDDWQMRRDVREFRAAIDHEIGLTLFVYEFRSRASSCTNRRARDLARWVKKAGEGAPLPPIDPHGPSYMVGYRTVWDSRDPDVFAHVPVEARRKYAEFYDEYAGNMMRLQAEEKAWAALIPYSVPGRITIGDRRAIIGAVTDALGHAATWDSNIPVSRKIAQDLGIEAIRPDSLKDEYLAAVEKCSPMFVGGSTANPASS